MALEHQEELQATAWLSGSLSGENDRPPHGRKLTPAETEVVSHPQIVEVVEAGQEEPESQKDDEPTGLGEGEIQGEISPRVPQRPEPESDEDGAVNQQQVYKHQQALSLGDLKGKFR